LPASMPPKDPKGPPDPPVDPHDPNQEDPPKPEVEHDDGEDEGEDQGEDEVKAGPNVHPDFVGMTSAQLRAFITEQTGKRPMGNPSQKTLLRMAEAART